MLAEMGIESGIDLNRLLDASRAVQDLLGRRLGAHLLTAGPVEWHRDVAGGEAALCAITDRNEVSISATSGI